MFEQVVQDLAFDSRGRIRFLGNWHDVPDLAMEPGTSGQLNDFAWRLVYLHHHARDHGRVQEMLAGGTQPRPLRLIEDRQFIDQLTPVVKHLTAESGWHLSSTAGKLTAHKDGLSLAVRPSDVLGSAPDPGRAVSIGFPAMQRYAAPGWVHVSGHRRPDQPKDVLRVYQPLGDPESVRPVIQFWMEALRSACSDFHLKFANNRRALVRADSFVAYLPVHGSGEQLIDALTHAVWENPLAGPPRLGPGFARALGGNVFAAFEPPGRTHTISYGQYCAQAAVDLVRGQVPGSPSWSLDQPWQFTSTQRDFFAETDRRLHASCPRVGASS